MSDHLLLRLYMYIDVPNTHQSAYNKPSRKEEKTNGTEIGIM